MAIDNWAVTVRQTPRRVVRPSVASASSPAELARRMGEIELTVKQAAREGRHVRALGRAWSFGREVLDAADVLIETEPLDRLIDATDAEGPLRAALHSSAQGAYAFVEAGAQLHALFGALAARGLTVITAGSSSGQSIAGVMSTATHGADFARAPLPDAVRALALVTPEGERVWLEPTDVPLTKSDAAAQTLLPGARVIRDTARFDAALVALGVMGVVCALVLEVRAMVGLSEKTTRRRWSEIRPTLGEAAPSSAFGPLPPGTAHPAPGVGEGRYGFLEVVVNPYPDANGDRHATLVTRVEAPAFSGTPWVRKTPELIDGLGTLWSIAAGTREDYRVEIDRLIAAGRTDSGGFHPAPDVFDFGETRTSRVWSAEAALSTRGDAHLAFFDALFARFDALFADDRRFAGFLSVRFTRGSRASLAMQSGPTGTSGRYCHVELFALQQPRHLGGWDPTRLAADSERFLDAFWDEVRARRASGLACLHWGQMARRPDDLAPASARFPRLPEWRAARAAIAGARPFTFANEWTITAGLSPLAAGWQLVGGALPRDRGAAPIDCAPIAASAPVLAWDPDVSARAELFCAEGDGYVGVLRVDGAAARWSIARAAGERVQADEAIAGAIALACNADGRPEIAARAVDGRIYHRWRESAAVGTADRWHGWTSFDGGPRFDADPALVRDGDRLLVAAVDRAGRVVVRRQTDLGGWTAWQALPSLPGARKADGRPALLRRGATLELVVRDRRGGLFRIQRAGSGWGAYESLGASGVAGDPAMAAGPGGALVVVPRSVGGLSAIWLDDALGPRPPVATFGTLALRERTRVAVARLRDVFHVAFTDPRGDLIAFRHGGASGWQGALAPLAAHAVSTPLVTAAENGRTRYYVRVAHDLLQTRLAP